VEIVKIRMGENGYGGQAAHDGATTDPCFATVAKGRMRCARFVPRRQPKPLIQLSLALQTYCWQALRSRLRLLIRWSAVRIRHDLPIRLRDDVDRVLAADLATGERPCGELCRRGSPNGFSLLVRLTRRAVPRRRDRMALRGGAEIRSFP
jgi:hypothetical protein